MKIKCEVIRDLFPSYIDGLTSKESNQLIEEHLGECRECREYLDEMKEELVQEKQPVKNKKAIKPFKKIRRKIWTALGTGVVVCALAFTGGIFYYGRVWMADSEDVSMKIEAEGGIATIQFSPKNDNRQLFVDSATGGEGTLKILERKAAPFTKVHYPNAYWSCTYIDENTVLSEGQEISLAEDQTLTIQYADRSETISIEELAGEALENPPAQSDEVKMTWEKDDNGTVTLGFFPEILGVSLKVEDIWQDKILIRQYYDGEGETVENGAFYTVNFIDEYNVQLPDGTILYIEDTLKIRYEDKTEEISFSDLREGNLPGEEQED